MVKLGGQGIAVRVLGRGTQVSQPAQSDIVLLKLPRSSDCKLMVLASKQLLKPCQCHL